MNNQPPVTIVATRPAEYLKQNSRFFVRDGAEMLTPAATVERQRNIERCADEMAQCTNYAEFETKRDEAMALGTMPTNDLVYQVAQASLMAD